MLDDPKHLATAPLHLAFQVLLLSLVIVVPAMVVLTAWHWRRLVSD